MGYTPIVVDRFIFMIVVLPRGDRQNEAAFFGSFKEQKDAFTGNPLRDDKSVLISKNNYATK